MALSPEFQAYVREVANRYGVPINLAFALITQESGGNQGAVSPKGATGIMQLMPGTAKELGVDPTDPYQNVEGGMRYLAQQYERFGTWPLALAAYNAGPGAVQKYGGIPPFAETQNYVPAILNRAGGMGSGSQSAAPGPGESLSQGDPAMDLTGRGSAFDVDAFVEQMFPEVNPRLIAAPGTAMTGSMGQMSPLSQLGIPGIDNIQKYSTPGAGAQ
jgi:hypothetical protein